VVGGRTDVTSIEVDATPARPRLVVVPEPVRSHRATRLQTWAALVALGVIGVLAVIVLLGG